MIIVTGTSAGAHFLNCICCTALGGIWQWVWPSLQGQDCNWVFIRCLLCWVQGNYVPHAWVWGFITTSGKTLRNVRGLMYNEKEALPWPGGSVEHHSHAPKGCGFNPQPGYLPRLWVQSLVRVHTEGNRLMFFSLSLSVSLSPPPCVSLSL